MIPPAAIELGHRCRIAYVEPQTSRASLRRHLGGVAAFDQNSAVNSVIS